MTQIGANAKVNDFAKVFEGVGGKVDRMWNRGVDQYSFSSYERLNAIIKITAEWISLEDFNTLGKYVTGSQWVRFPLSIISDIEYDGGRVIIHAENYILTSFVID